MAAKKKDKLDKLTDLVKSQARTLKIILEHTAALTEDMSVVKSDLAAVKAIATSNSDHLVSIESEIKGIRSDATIANKRISTIESHLNLNKKIAA